MPAALAALMAAACATEPPTQPPIDLADTQWMVEDIDGQGVADKVESTLSIDASGRASGIGGCNRYFGDVNHNDGAISFGPLGSTRMACPQAVMDQEQRFFAALEASRTYRQDDLTGLLYFQDEAGTDVLRFRRMRKIEAAE
ncbi:MAG: META domain-containing protein [Chromatiales bacterium]|nr:MAG: META domain-containing protein [Chromatiales bacterium]